MAADPPSAEVARFIAAAEEMLRRQGFTERTIRDRRKATRAQIEAHLSRKDLL